MEFGITLLVIGCTLCVLGIIIRVCYESSFGDEQANNLLESDCEG